VTRRRGRRRKTLRTGEDTLILRRKLSIALYGGTVLEEALDLSSHRILNE
jgi:archaeosine-15-forming tRNA-guanine transglycosylase